MSNNGAKVVNLVPP